jgi:hypothetical protein
MGRPSSPQGHPHGVGPTPEQVLGVKQRIVRTAAGMEAGEIELFEGCRKLADLRFGLDDEELDDPDMSVFQAIDSELDAYPFGPSRERWAPEFLADLDARKADYLERVRDTVLSACRAVRLKWAGPNGP